MRVSSPVWTASLAIAALPAVDAFYPYARESAHVANALSKREQPATMPSAPREGGSMTLPLRRVRTRQEDIYKILKSNDPKQKNSVAIDQDGRDLSYMVAVTFGDSKEEYQMLLDSASSGSWVMGQDCQAKACSMHPALGNTDSKTLKVDESASFNITYGTGTVSGILASDTLHIGGLTPSFTFGLATDVSKDFEAYPMSGILGLGRGSKVAGNIGSPQVMDVLKTSNLIGSKLYALHLNRAEDGLNDGEFNLGEPNKERYDGDLNNIPAIENDFGLWEIGLDDAGVGGNGLGISGRTAFIDSGTSFIFVPETDATAIHDLIAGSTKKGKENYVVPCDTDTAIWFSFGSQKYNISAADWVGEETDGGCSSNIIGRTTFAETQWLVGDVFLKNVYSVFDFENSQIGFGVKSGEGGKTPTNTDPPSASGTAAPDVTETGSPITGGNGTRPEAGTPSSPSGDNGNAAHTTTPSTPLLLSIVLGLFSLYL